ncbi:Diaminopimelate epimerase [Ralstonia solanacearum]|nr:Diaminopimelate epimerase [Ralstonia solanacearum]
MVCQLRFFLLLEMIWNAAGSGRSSGCYSHAITCSMKARAASALIALPKARRRPTRAGAP